jgi:hypothetical protein
MQAVDPHSEKGNYSFAAASLADYSYVFPIQYVSKVITQATFGRETAKSAE